MAGPSTYKVKIGEDELTVTEGENLYEQIMAHKIPIKASCGGFGQCGDCVVKVLAGEDHLPPLALEETQLLGNVFFITKERLSCRIAVAGDLEITIIKSE